MTVTLMIVIAGLVWWNAAQKSASTIDEITLAPQPLTALSLIWIAEHEGYFTDNNLKVNITPPGGGRELVNALETDNADVSTLGEYTYVKSDVEKYDLRVFAAIDAANSIELLARTDKGIMRPSDLGGKTIGVIPATEPEFSLLTFFVKNDLSTTSGVKIIDLTPENTVDAIVSGRIDAVMTNEPYLYQIRKSLGDKVTGWPGQSDQPYYIVLVSKNDFIVSHKTAISKLLRSLVKAEKYIKENPTASQHIVAARLGYDIAQVAQRWPEHNFGLSLREDMVTLMDDQSRWAIQNEIVDKTQSPKFRDLIYFDALEKVKPDAITVTR